MSKDDTAVNDQVETETTATESAPVENDKSVTAENALDDDAFVDIDDGLTEEETGGEDSNDETAEETNTEEQQGEEKPLAPKSENRFQKLANENRDLKEQIERLSLQETQLASEQELLNEVNPETGEYYTPQEVERIAFQQARETQQQSIAQQRYELQVQQNQQTIQSEASQALQDFSMFDAKPDANGNPTNPLYDLQAAKDADALLSKSLIFNDKGVLVGSSLSPYQIYKSIADSAERAATRAQTVGQANAQRATEKMLANADVPTGNSQATKDTDLDDFDKAFDD